MHHAYGHAAAQAVEAARQQLASLLNVDSGCCHLHQRPPPKRITSPSREFLAAAPAHAITTAVEHPTVLAPPKKLQRRGCDVTFLPVDSAVGVYPQLRSRSALQPDTKLVSVILASNEIGSLNPLQEIGALCQQRGILLHTDATQAVGKIPLDLQTLSVDLLSLSAHKFYGPQGIGALIVRERNAPLRLEPLFEGGGQEKRLRSGTLPVPLIVGLGAVAEIAQREMHSDAIRLAALRDKLWDALHAEFPELRRNTPFTDILPHNLNVTVPDVDGEALIHALTRIAVSSGSACSTTDPRPSHVLQAIGLSEQQAKASLRFGLGRFTTAEEIDLAYRHVIDVLHRLQTERVA
ncbi:MAG: cysteine desulfurase family protein [Planctomycetales bacterium]